MHLDYIKDKPLIKKLEAMLSMAEYSGDVGLEDVESVEDLAEVWGDCVGTVARFRDWVVQEAWGLYYVANGSGSREYTFTDADGVASFFEDSADAYPEEWDNLLADLCMEVHL